jgi:hypothetical protein
MVTARPRRRRFQFSILSLFVVTALMALLVARYSVPAWRQREAVAQIIDTGGEVNYDYQFAGAKSPPGPTWLRESIGDDFFQRVARVQLERNVDTEDELHTALDQVARLPTIDHLIIRSREGITEANLQAIARLRTLKSLHLQGPAPDAGLAQLTKLNRLIALTVQNVTDRTLTQIAKLHSLEHLYLEGTVSDDGLAQLRSLVELQELIYNRGRIVEDLQNSLLFDYTDTSLRDVIQFFHDQGKVVFRFDQESLAAKKISIDELLVTGAANGITVQHALDPLLEQNGLGYRLEKDAVVITTHEEADQARAGIRALQKKLPKLKVTIGW